MARASEISRRPMLRSRNCATRLTKGDRGRGGGAAPRSSTDRSGSILIGVAIVWRPSGGQLLQRVEQLRGIDSAPQLTVMRDRNDAVLLGNHDDYRIVVLGQTDG